MVPSKSYRKAKQEDCGASEYQRERGCPAKNWKLHLSHDTKVSDSCRWEPRRSTRMLPSLDKRILGKWDHTVRQA